MSQMPSKVGDPIDFVIRWQPPKEFPAGVVTAGTLVVKAPNGTETMTAASVMSTNVLRYVHPLRINAAGRWYIRINADQGMQRSVEWYVDITASAFGTPVPP